MAYAILLRSAGWAPSGVAARVYGRVVLVADADRAALQSEVATSPAADVEVWGPPISELDKELDQALVDQLEALDGSATVDDYQAAVATVTSERGSA